MGRNVAASHRSLSPFERHLLAQHFRDPAVRAAEIARRRQARIEAADSAGPGESPKERFFKIFLCAALS